MQDSSWGAVEHVCLLLIDKRKLKNVLSCSPSLCWASRLSHVVFVALSISENNREAEVVVLNCYNLSICFSVVFFFHLLFPGYVAFVLDTVNMFMCRTLAPSPPHKCRRLLQPEVAHRRYRLHLALLIFSLFTWQVFVFTQLSFFPARSVFDQKLKTGRTKPLSNAKCPAFPNLSGLQQYYTAMTRHYSFKNRKLICFFVFLEWVRQRKKAQKTMLMHTLIGISGNRTLLLRIRPECARNLTNIFQCWLKIEREREKKICVCFGGAD